jgi:hypothetical protein
MRMPHTVVFAALMLALCSNPRPASASLINFSALPNGTDMNPDAFSAQGILFDAPYFVGFVQSTHALVGEGTTAPIGASFTASISALSVTVAQSFAVSGVYILTAFDSSQALVATTTVTTSVSGFSTVDLGGFAPTAVSFTLENDANFGSPALNEFALGSVQFTPVPEPSTLFLALMGMGVLAYTRCRAA